ncbi:hypothetical protein FAM21835_02092 [Lentilactobacillus parabuchneri]|jgi:hypothetical protein|uniref:Gp138 family membrane-puncturing spike protein n=1 Tax=Lentilactobacillus TaxID=2767893 RepID=UPI000A0FEAA8|nr:MULTISPECIES: Gp138 family membrane-puncturing spike protein [Lentilactobacillus]MQM81515.1 hypothetical protein [Lentilactobacillus buchneri]ORN25114.1 hypothetical protein FAM21835_02092 [Lentilactobacillus parabuchneri]GED95544.1 hypothetical protein LBSP_21040 [Lentilactobacillus buchneri subsp. silagei]DAZ30546.1 MAG TPA: baseplate protein [Caudoviricetes sp.]
MAKSRDYMDEFFQTYKNEIMGELSSAMRCKIVKVNSDKTYDVQPLALYADGTKRPQLLSLSACYIPMVITLNGDTVKVTIDYKVGDVVMVVFEDRDNSNARGSNAYKIDSERMHDKNDGVIVGKIDLK